MNVSAVKRMTVPEFLAWAERQERGRYELVRGQVVAISPQRAEHGRGKFLAATALKAAIRRAGVACEAFVDSVAVRIDEETAYEPDVLVNCGDPVPADS